HRCPFIEEEADVALWLGQCQGSSQRPQRFLPLPLRLERQRTQQEDFDDTAHARLGLGVQQQPLQQGQGLKEVGPSRLLAPLGDASSRQGQVGSLAGVAQGIGGRQAALLRPPYGRRQVALGQGQLCPYGGPVSQQSGGKAALVGQLCEGIERLECPCALPTGLLEAS